MGGRGGRGLRDRRDVPVRRRGAAGARRRSGRPGSRPSSRWRSTASPSRARAGRRRRRAGGWRTPAPRSSGSTASAARRRCCRCWERCARRSTSPSRRCRCPYRTHEAEPTFQSLGRRPRLPGRARPATPAPATRWRSSRARRSRSASPTSGCAAARRRTTSARWPRRWAGAARQPLLARHVQARLPRLRPEPAGREPRVRGAALAVYRYAVIGGGGIGSAAAYWLSRRAGERGPVPRAVASSATGAARPRTTRGSSGSGTTRRPTRR